jgi:hypothetical protein
MKSVWVIGWNDVMAAPIYRTNAKTPEKLHVNEFVALVILDVDHSPKSVDIGDNLKSLRQLPSNTTYYLCVFFNQNLSVGLNFNLTSVAKCRFITAVFVLLII